MRPTFKYVALAAVGLVIIYLAVTRIIDARRTDESRVRLLFREVAEYARARDPGGVLEHLDPEYRDPQGFIAPMVRRMVLGYFSRAEAVEAEFEPLGIEGLEVEGDEVDVLVRARLAVHMPGNEVLTFGDAGMSGDYFIVSLRRHGAYFRARSVRPAGREEVPER